MNIPTAYPINHCLHASMTQTISFLWILIMFTFLFSKAIFDIYILNHLFKVINTISFRKSVKAESALENQNLHNIIQQLNYIQSSKTTRIYKAYCKLQKSTLQLLLKNSLNILSCIVYGNFGFLFLVNSFTTHYLFLQFFPPGKINSKWLILYSLMKDRICFYWWFFFFPFCVRAHHWKKTTKKLNYFTISFEDQLMQLRDRVSRHWELR